MQLGVFMCNFGITSWPLLMQQDFLLCVSSCLCRMKLGCCNVTSWENLCVVQNISLYIPSYMSLRVCVFLYLRFFMCVFFYVHVSTRFFPCPFFLFIYIFSICISPLYQRRLFLFLFECLLAAVFTGEVFFLQRIFGWDIDGLNKYGVKSLVVEDFEIEKYADNGFWKESFGVEEYDIMSSGVRSFEVEE